MKNIGFILLFIIAFGFIGCSTKESNITEISNGIRLSIEPNKNWKVKKKIPIFNRIPQFAAWLEDDNGNYISTITVTNRSAKKSWLGSAPKEGRPEALPVWEHRMQTGSVRDNIEAVSKASPKGQVEMQINNGSLINGQSYNVYLEINHSFDYNETWTKSNSGVNGQPSLIYHAQFIMGQEGSIILLPIGCGAVDGSNGNIIDGTDGLTTALEIIKNASLIFN